MVEYYYPKMTKEEELIKYLEKIIKGEDTTPEDIKVDIDDE